MDDNMAYTKEMIALANKMRLIADNYGPQEIFFASALLISWVLYIQNNETRTHAIDTVKDMIENGFKLFGKDDRQPFDA